VTLTDAVTRWIDQRAINLAASTCAGYRRLLRLYVAGTEAGGKELDEVDASDLVELLRPLIQRGCTRQAQLLQVMLGAVLKFYVKHGQLTRNPMEELDRVKHKSKFTAWLTVDQARQLLKVARESKDPFYLAWLLMLCCGLRRGEMLALEWGDVDLTRGILRIRRQEITIDGQTMVTRPKSLASIRDICLAPELITELRLHCRASGRILDVAAWELAEGLDRALIRAELPRITLHGMRHTMAAVAAGNGVAVKVLQSIMGHAHYSTTADIYEHVDDTARQQAARIITGGLIPARLEIV
jgi:integrase